MYCDNIAPAAKPVYFVNGKLCIWENGNDFRHGGYYEIPASAITQMNNDNSNIKEAQTIEELTDENLKLVAHINELEKKIETAKELLEYEMGEWVSVTPLYSPNYVRQLKNIFDVLDT